VIKAWRIVKTRFASSAFDGEGARKFGGRFNSVGVPVVYTAGSRSLAILEMLVHIGDRSILSSYSLCSVEFDEGLVEMLRPADLPLNWQDHPPRPEVLAIGDEWISSKRSLVLQVPSAVVPDEANYLINPNHPDLQRLQIGTPEPISLDKRLLKK
jgi:RES domain-containing protein